MLSVFMANVSTTAVYSTTTVEKRLPVWVRICTFRNLVKPKTMVKKLYGPIAVCGINLLCYFYIHKVYLKLDHKTKYL